MTEDEIYEQIDRELNDSKLLIRSLWTRVYAEVDGDEAKSKARYIKERAKQLGSTHDNFDQKDDHRQEIPTSKPTYKLLEFAIYPYSLTSAQLAELEIAKEEATKEIEALNPQLTFMMAGLSASDGGAVKTLEFLDKSFG